MLLLHKSSSFKYGVSIVNFSAAGESCSMAAEILAIATVALSASNEACNKLSACSFRPTSSAALKQSCVSKSGGAIVIQSLTVSGGGSELWSLLVEKQHLGRTNTLFNELAHK